MKNIRRLLKPGGKVALFEIVQRTCLSFFYLFGVHELTKTRPFSSHVLDNDFGRFIMPSIPANSVD